MGGGVGRGACGRCTARQRQQEVPPLERMRSHAEQEAAIENAACCGVGGSFKTENRPSKSIFDLRLVRTRDDAVPASYHGSLVGNRPEMMPLDFHLFNDWHVGAHDAIIKTSHLPAGPPDHPSKYGRYRGTGLAGRRRLRSLRRSGMRGSIIPQNGALCKM